MASVPKTLFNQNLFIYLATKLIQQDLFQKKNKILCFESLVDKELSILKHFFRKLNNQSNKKF